MRYGSEHAQTRGVRSRPCAWVHGAIHYGKLLFSGAILLFVALFVTSPAFSAPSGSDVGAECRKALATLRINVDVDLDAVCSGVAQLDGCESEKGSSIYHFDRFANASRARRVLVLSLVHGDEPESAVAAKLWMARLLRIEPRSSWRIIPVLNPDGFAAASRMNSRGVDLNRNFPTRDWHDRARRDWQSKRKRDPRRFPGDEPASEKETRCAMKHIDAFRPDLVVAIHTPYGILDFDGPKDMAFPKAFLPWVSLGHFPGSLGRYMWHDRSVPVLTIELKGEESLESLADLDKLQDISGTLAVQIKPRPSSGGH